MFKKNLTFLSLVNVYVKLTSLAIIPFITRRFSVEDFGVWAVTQTLLGYVLDSFDQGVKKIGIRELSKLEGPAFESMASRVFSVRFVLLGMAFVLMNGAGMALFTDPAYRTVIFIISLSVPLQAFDVTWIYDSRQNMQLTCRSKLIERTVYLLVSVIGIFFFSLKVLAFSFPVSIAFAAAAVWFLWKDVPLQWMTPQGRIMKEGLIVGFSGLASALCLTVDQFVIKHFLGTYELGLYCAATKLFFVVLTFLWVYAYALFPRISASHGDQAEIKRVLEKHTVLLGVGVTALVAFFCIFADPLIRLFFSDKFLSIVPVFKLLNIFLVMAFFNALFSDSLTAFDLQKERLYIILGGVMANVVLNIAWVPVMGLAGAVYASIAAQAMILAMSYGRVQKVYPTKAGKVLLGFLILNVLIVVASFKI